MASRWLSRAALACVVGGVVTATGAATGWAADPGGNNGTVKIQSTDVDGPDNPDPANDPHVPCTFQLAFFGFDTNQTAKITFTIQPPSGTGDAVLLSETRTVSDDPAGGSADVDAVFTYDASTWGLGAYTAQVNQGYHVKLTIESAGVPSGVKHKVFWLQCAAPTSGPTSPPPTSGGPTPTDSASPTGNPTDPGTTTTPGTSSSGGGGGGGNLPVTGAGLTGIILAGAALIGGGTVLLIARRRRTAEDSATQL
jgi:LPXTG-motif cell wall-anchored protein